LSDIADNFEVVITIANQRPYFLEEPSNSDKISGMPLATNNKSMTSEGAGAALTLDLKFSSMLGRQGIVACMGAISEKSSNRAGRDE
jgi:hypothetical protein